MLTFLLVFFLAMSAARAEELPNETYCLAQNLYHEVRGEDAAGVVAAGSVVLNRVESKRFPNTICKVVRQGGKRLHKCQFSWYCDGRSDATENRRAWKKMLFLAEKLLDGSIADNTDGALFYHTTTVNPYWNTNMQPKMRLGIHIFY